MKKAAYSALSTRAWEYLKSLKTVDILVGIPSYNSAHTINYVIYQAAKGLRTHFPNMKTAIFVSDGNSTDGTLATVKAMSLPFEVSIIPATYTGVSGKGSAVKAILEAASFLEVQAVGLVDSDLRSITPEWIRLLVSPVLTGTGFVTPFYVRHKYDGTITNFLCYPVTSSLYGKDIRQPIGGDFGLSIELVKELLESPLWQTHYVRHFGIDIFETHTALAEKFEVKQAFLGAKVHEAKDPAMHLGAMFRQVVGSMFTCIEHYEEAWKEIDGRCEIETIGEPIYEGSPEAVHVDLQNLLKSYRIGFAENRKIYRAILSKEDFKETEKLKKMSDFEVYFTPETWAKIVFTFAARFKSEKVFTRERLLDALRTLWIGKVAAYVQETFGLDIVAAEKRIEEEARAFENLKPYLLEVF